MTVQKVFRYPGTAHQVPQHAVVPPKTTNTYQVFFTNGSDTNIEADRVEYGSSMIRFYLDTGEGVVLESALNVVKIEEIRQVDSES